MADNTFEALKSFVNDVYGLIGKETTPLDDCTNVFELAAEIKSEDLGEALLSFEGDEADENKIYEKAASLAASAEGVNNLWKFAIIFKAIGVDLEAHGDIIGKIDQVAETSKDALKLLSNAMSEKDLSDVLDDDIDFFIGCLFAGVEASLKTCDEEWLDIWITGFGNCIEYDNEVANFLSPIDSEFRNYLLGEYMRFLKYYNIDTFEEGDFRSEEEGVDWNAVSREMSSYL